MAATRAQLPGERNEAGESWETSNQQSSATPLYEGG